MAEKKMGTIASVKHVSSSDSGWRRYDTVLEDGDAFRAVIPPDCDHVIKVGDKLSFFKGQYNSWVINKSDLPGGGGASPKANGSPKGKSSGGQNSSTDYWRNKFDHEVNHKDPKLEFQGYLGKTSEMYAAGINSLDKPLHKMTDKEFETFCTVADGLVDSCFAKAKEVYRRINKKDVKTEEEAPAEVTEE